MLKCEQFSGQKSSRKLIKKNLYEFSNIIPEMLSGLMDLLFNNLSWQMFLSWAIEENVNLNKIYFDNKVLIAPGSYPIYSQFYHFIIYKLSIWF